MTLIAAAKPQVLAKGLGDTIPPDLRALLVAHDIVPLWEADDSVLRGGPSEPPRVWRWADLRPIIEAASMITEPAVVERRVLQLKNPDIRSSFSGSCGLINATVQSTRPGEVARPHRHTMNALRFGLEGSTGETVVDGKVCRMGPGDLVITPAWTWHGHRNPGDEHTIWLDILDVPLHVSLGTAKFQPGPTSEGFATFADDLFEIPGIMPLNPAASALPHSPLFRYPWADVVRALDRLPARPDGSKQVRYVNPLGGPVLSLIDCTVLELAEGESTEPFRSTASAVCIVVEGTGSTRTTGQTESTTTWGINDVITLPQHSWVTHRADGGPARLFVASNREVYRRLGMLVEETGPVHAA